MALTSDTASAAFADLVYADQALVDAEFAGIVAASFGGPPAPPPEDAAGVPSRPGLPHPVCLPFAAVAGTPFATAWPPGRAAALTSGARPGDPRGHRGR